MYQAAGEGNQHENSSYNQELTTKLRIRLQAANLPRSGIRARGSLEWPDTYAIVTSQTCSNAQDLPESPKDNQRSIWGRTEVIYKNRNPQWIETITIDNYERGSKQFFHVLLCQHVPSSSGLVPKSFGTALFEVSDILGSPSRTKVKRLRTGGCVFCRLEVVREEAECHRVSLQVGARGLDLPHDKRRLLLTAGNLFHKEPDTFVEIAKSTMDDTCQTWTTIHRSPLVYNSINPTWDATEIDLNSLCNNNMDNHLRFHVYMLQKNGSKSLVGLCETTLKHLLENGEASLDSSYSLDEDAFDHKGCSQEFQLQRSSTKLKDVGRLKIIHAHLVSGEDSFRVNCWRNLINSCESQDCGSSNRSRALCEIADLARMPSKKTVFGTDFKYYVDKGCELDLCLAVDFTSSNGDPRLQTSYHFQDEVALNDYEETIISLGTAIAHYSQSKQFTVWGFGAKFQDGIVRHIFQCGPDPAVIGVDGIVSAYRSVFHAGLTMSGPTIYTEVLQAAAVRAKKHDDAMSWQSLRYTVLLIITDGVMDNMEEMQRKLSVYSSMPLSVIFVGIGRSDFRSLNQLCRRQTPARQIASFVDFRRYQDNPSSLGFAALSQLPSQVCDYMESRGFS